MHSETSLVYGSLLGCLCHEKVRALKRKELFLDIVSISCSHPSEVTVVRLPPHTPVPFCASRFPLQLLRTADTQCSRCAGGSGEHHIQCSPTFRRWVLSLSLSRRR